MKKSREQQQEQQHIQNRESNQQHHTGRRSSNISRKSLGCSQQREEEKRKGQQYRLSSGANNGAIEKEKDINKMQELLEIFGGTDGDGIDEGDGSVIELNAASVGSDTETVP